MAVAELLKNVRVDTPIPISINNDTEIFLLNSYFYGYHTYVDGMYGMQSMISCIARTKKVTNLILQFRSSHWRCSIKKGFLKKIRKIHWKTPVPESLLNKIAGHYIKKETLAHMFSCVFCKILKNTFFTEHLQVTASDVCYPYSWWLLKTKRSWTSSNTFIKNILSFFEITWL